jgi:hypothetical protein
VRSVVLRRLSRWSLGRDVAPGHTAVDNKVRAIDEAALVAGKEKHALGLLNSLTEAASGEVDFTTGALDLVVTEPVLEKRGAEIFSTLMPGTG